MTAKLPGLRGRNAVTPIVAGGAGIIFGLKADKLTFEKKTLAFFRRMYYIIGSFAISRRRSS